MPDARFFPLAGARRQNAFVQAWFESQRAEVRTLARLWHDVWLSCGPDVEELLHDGHPTVCVQDVALGSVNAFTKHVSVGFYLGATLPDPEGILEGSGKFMRHVKIQLTKPIADTSLRDLIRTAYLDLKARLADKDLGT